MEITDDTIGIWFVDGPDYNWMLILFKEGNLIKGTYRFRYFEDEKAFGSKDGKSWTNLTSGKAEKETIEDIREFSKVISLKLGNPVDELLKGDLSVGDFTREMMKRDYMQMSMATKEQMEKMGYDTKGIG